jgi:tRNA A37 threonylcarbamoyladenosine biosynthesis protein TsaE
VELQEYYRNLQQQLKSFLEKNLTLVVTGGAGAGKTAFVNRVVAPKEFLEANQVDPSQVRF